MKNASRRRVSQTERTALSVMKSQLLRGEMENRPKGREKSQKQQRRISQRRRQTQSAEHSNDKDHCDSLGRLKNSRTKRKFLNLPEGETGLQEGRALDGCQYHPVLRENRVQTSERKSCCPDFLYSVTTIGQAWEKQTFLYTRVFRNFITQSSLLKVSLKDVLQQNENGKAKKKEDLGLGKKHSETTDQCIM